MENKWQELWKNKQLENETPSLEELIAMVGWYSNEGGLPKENWLEFIDSVVKKLSIEQSDKLLEVGCGSGGYLLPFYEKDFDVSGIDYSGSLIEICKKVMPNGKFEECEAKNLSFESDNFDVITSNSVFHYFQDHDYTKEVIKEMARCLKVGGRGAILDLNDLSKEDAFMQHRYERFGGKEEYEKQNKELPQLFYDKQWILDVGEEFGLEGYVEDQNISWYRNSIYRFNYFFKKVK